MCLTGGVCVLRVMGVSYGWCVCLTGAVCVLQVVCVCLTGAVCVLQVPCVSYRSCVCPTGAACVLQVLCVLEKTDLTSERKTMRVLSSMFLLERSPTTLPTARSIKVTIPRIPGETAFIFTKYLHQISPQSPNISTKYLHNHQIFNFFFFLIIGYPDSALPFFRPSPHFIHTISDHYDMP